MLYVIFNNFDEILVLICFFFNFKLSNICIFYLKWNYLMCDCMLLIWDEMEVEVKSSVLFLVFWGIVICWIVF